MLVDIIKQIHVIGVRIYKNRAIIARIAFWIVLALFISEALSVALTAKYPLPIDESYHFGLIQFYSHQLLPFVHSQPPDASQFGDITRYDSYLYHYLMSFPYRILTFFTHDQHVQILVLRCLSIALFVGSLVLARKILLTMNIKNSAINSALFVFILLPMTPFLAAHINYDSLFILTLMVFVWIGQKIISLARGGLVPRRLLVLFMSVGLLGCLVKYSFLPIALAGILIVGSCLVRHRENISRRRVRGIMWRERAQLLVVGVFFLLSFGLFAERYGANLIQYHSIEPDCSRLHSVQDCSNYGPWYRNWMYEQNEEGSPPVSRNPLIYLVQSWLPISVNGIGATYDSTGTLGVMTPLMNVVSWSTIIAIVLVFLVTARGVFRDRHQLLVVGISTLYVLVLFINNFAQFEEFRHVVAVQGRYILPLLPLLLGIVFEKLYLFLRLRWQTISK